MGSSKKMFMSFAALVGILCLICMSLSSSLLALKEYGDDIDLPSPLDDVLKQVPDLDDITGGFGKDDKDDDDKDDDDN